MEPINVPLAAQWCSTPISVSTPDGGFVYLGWESINYISNIESNKTPTIKSFQVRQKVKCIDCDPDWSESKHIVISAEDKTVQVWDLDEGKAKKGHNAHIKKVLEDGEVKNMEIVRLCYLRNRKIFSIDSTSSVIYCPMSNSYVKHKRIIPLKHDISIVTPSPYDENILAFGTVNGLILVLNLEEQNVLYTFRGHESLITSLSWNKVVFNSTKNISEGKVQQDQQHDAADEHDNDGNDPQDRRKCVKTKLFKRTDPNTKATYLAEGPPSETSETKDNDIFDIFDYVYLERDTFGVPNKTCDKSIENKINYDSDEANIIDIEPNKESKDVPENANFNYVEACQNLKDEILLTQSQPISISPKPQQQNDYREVTLSDCKKYKTRVFYNSSYSSSPSSPSPRSSPFGSPDIAPLDNPFEMYKSSRHSKEPDNRSELSFGNGDEQIHFLLASGSNESTVWIWDVRTGEVVNHFNLKRNALNIAVQPVWINETTLITNSRAGDVSIFKCSTPIDRNTKLNFALDKSTILFNDAIVAINKSQISNRIWMISYNKEIICEDLDKRQIIGRYSCSSTNIASIRQCPTNPNKMVFGTGDRRIGILDTSRITPSKLKIENCYGKVDSPILTVCWSPNSKYVAFGTKEGRLGVVSVEKGFGSPLTVLKPFSGKPIYSIHWYGKHIFACSGEKVATYEWNKKPGEPIILGNITDASVLHVKSHYLLVGTQNGFLNIFKRDDLNTIDFERITSTFVAPKYISEIAFSPKNESRFALSSAANKIVVFSISYDTDVLTNERVLMLGDYSSGNAWVSFSSHNENLLLSCGFDGIIRVWDLSLNENELIFIKQFPSPMLCGLFLPHNENIILCAGKATSLVMFDMTKEKSSILPSSKINTKINKKKKKSEFAIQWATKVQDDTKKSLKQKQRNSRGQIKRQTRIFSTDNTDEDQNDDNGQNECDFIHQLNQLEISEPDPSTILITTNIEMYQKVFDSLLTVLLNDEVNPEDGAHCLPKKEILIMKMFGSAEDAQELLMQELHHHHESFGSLSVADIIIPQMANVLKEEIEDAIENRGLTIRHVSLAPSVSYSFWKLCCAQFAYQLIEKGFALRATPYLLACHQVNECIDVLMQKNCFREAWIIAKLHREQNDPVFDEIFNKWFDYLDSSGNYESAALICALTKRYQDCKNILLKRRNITEEHKIILDILNRRLQLN